MAKTKKPTGLKITVSGEKFITSWKRGDANYTNGLDFEYVLGSGKFKNAKNVKVKATKHAIEFDKDDYYPNTKTKNGKKTNKPYLKLFKVRIRGNRASYKKKGKKIDPTWSDYAPKQLTIGIPPVPKLSVSHSTNPANRTTFSWTVDTSDSTKIFTDVEYTSILVPSSQINTKDLGKLKWKSSTEGYIHATGLSASSSKNVDEEGTHDFDLKPMARVFRARARGVAGASKWVYKTHVYARPNAPTISDVKYSERSNGYLVSVKWESPADKTIPIDETVVQYAKTVVGENVTVPEGFENWQEAGTVKDTKDSNALTFSVNGKLEDNQCLFVRVVNYHDGKDTDSDSVVVIKGSLEKPHISDWQTHESTHSITIQVDNDSDVPDANTVVLYRPDSNPEATVIIGIIANGDTQEKVFVCPDWSGETSFSIGIYSAVGTYERIQTDSYDSYMKIEELMTSPEVWDGGSISLAPSQVSVEAVGSGTARIFWDWSWPEATSAQLTWANHEDAWESTDEPDSYDVGRANASRWNISGLSAGTRWYFRVRLVKESGDISTYGPWSEIVSTVLSTAPTIPSVYLSTGFLTEGESVTAYWAYVSTDGTSQDVAEIKIAEDDGEYGEPISTVGGEQYMTLNSTEMGWTAGHEYKVCVRLKSASGEYTKWSNPVSLYVAAPLVATINSTSLVTATDGEGDEAETGTTLTVLPLELNVTGAGEGGSTDVIIERADSFHMDRPDESELDGYKGEAVVIKHVEGDGDIEITVDDINGALDDTAPYNLIVRVSDAYRSGEEVYTRTDESEPIPFTVHWEHQAIVPEATVEMYKGVPKITPKLPEELPEGWTFAEGDSISIYRLSADKPELIYEGAQFDETYVDPFPAIGEKGGHRLVYVTKDGDYTTADGGIAWLDLDDEDGDIFESDKSIIDFGLDRVELYYNVDVSSTWNKDFKRTTYLGGSVQGDWNPAVTRDTSINAITIPIVEQDTIDAMRRLADYPDICHVRTVDGSSFAADVQVSENREHDTYGMLVSFELQTQKVDAQEPEGMTFERWSELYDRVIMPDGDAVLMPDGYVMAVDVVED